MAEVIGFLRPQAQDGEKQTLKLLGKNLPKEYSVYVETPLHKKRDIRYPDFIVLTNYGVIVLEVKDWVTIVGEVGPHGCTIRMRSGETRFEPNPVGKAREFAITLSNELNKKRKRSFSGEAIPWSYAVILFNLPTSVITQLRRPWGEEFVLGKADLENPDLLLRRLKMIFPAERMRPLMKAELEMIRATIYPVVEIEMEGRPSFVLDSQQEKIVAEPIRPEVPSISPKAQRKAEAKRMEQLFENLRVEEKEDALPQQAEQLSKNVAIRLIRGFSGSGKTLVLVQRAKFLAAQYPEWKICVLTFNKPLQEQLERDFTGTSIKPRTFHSICQSIMHKEGEAFNLDGWLEQDNPDHSIIQMLGKEAIKNEFEWLQDMALTDTESYLRIERHGIGASLRLTKEQRGKIFEAFKAYRSYLKDKELWDWHELPLMTLKRLREDKVSFPSYDAILIDEAQDWAPSWFHVTNHLLDPEHGLLFLADDPSQSIYRYFSWREKGVDVVGRTRWLKVPYRNTYEIYQAAYSLIADHAGIQSSLSDEGELVKPDLSSDEMRHGPKPLVQKFYGVADEYAFIKNRVEALRRDGFRDNQIAILARNKNDIEPIREAIKGYDVRINSIHSFKGLEEEVIFIPHMQKTFIKDDETYQEAERRLMYMAMSRARSQLYMTYTGKLSRVYDTLLKKELADFLS